MTSDSNTLPLPLGPAPDDCEALWIPADEFQALVGIHKSNASEALRKCYEGGTWRKYSLLVRTVEGQGGASGKSYQVRVDTLPPALYFKWLEKRQTALPAPAPRLGDPIPMPAQIDPQAAKRQAEIDWKARILAPAMAYDEHSPGRIQVMKEIAASTHIGLDGKPKRVALRTLYAWIERVKEAGGLRGLARKSRLEKPDRHLICRAWDKACPLPEPVKQDIAREIETYVRGLWAAGVPGWSDCNQKASSKLLELSKAAGWENATFKVCMVGRYFVDKHSEAKLIAIKEKDAKRWFDHHTPRIQRSRDGLRPTDIVVGDVHPVDIVVRREDGTEGTYRLIAWLDIATNDLFCTLVLLAPGKGITQAHVAASFAAMVGAWGLPRLLMLDNGSEYSWAELERGFRELAYLARDMRIMMRQGNDTVPIIDNDDSLDARPDPILRALPHRPCSKPIEGIFGVLERLLSMLPGWIGGDRMNKRTHKMGKAPKPFPGTPEKFETLFHQALAYYRTKPQKGLRGCSPDETRAKFNTEGIALPPSIPPEVLVFALSEEKTPKVQTGGIEVDGNWYQGDGLVKCIGQRVTVRYAKWAPDYVFMRDADGKLAQIARRPIFPYVGGVGAKEQSRLASVQNAYIQELKATTRKVDLPTEMSRHVASVGLDVPVLKGPEIFLTPELSAVADDTNPSALSPEEIGPDEVLDRKTGEITPLIPDHYANRSQRHEFEDYGESPDWRQQAAIFLPNKKPSEGATSPGFDEAIPKTGTTR